jgi:hypothetical protein
VQIFLQEGWTDEDSMSSPIDFGILIATQAKAILKQYPEANIWAQEEWRRLHNEKLHSLYRPTNIYVVWVIRSRGLRWAGHAVKVEGGRRSFKILTGTLTGNKSLRRPRRRWEDNIRMELKEIGINRMNWVDAAQDRDYWRALVNAVETS